MLATISDIANKQLIFRKYRRSTPANSKKNYEYYIDI